ncbi:HIRAN domain-containing protein [Arthrobacter sp. H14-L1]|uniref:HIRAN domain-containing protein n=1 Tax=Arthrobacter sp. H14-L1 TaxID=2996697 RepID=UPI00226FE6CD|nr:HIRAN domain-containing protein [Arthrobacter sp. H14-L1]MCY0906203.1 HIRAN domain-containing protein [Arthrobacter sp. H14-L1]
MEMIQKLTAMLRGGEKEVKTPKQTVAEPVVEVAEPAEEVVDHPVPAHEPEVVRAMSEPEGAIEPKPAGVKKVMLDEAALSVLDLRELPSSRFRIVGSAYWVTDSARYKHGGNDYVLVREPKNKWDANAVAVYSKGRKVGYLAEAKAAALAPIFDELAFDAYKVGGTSPQGNSRRMWVDVPAIPKLRAFVMSLDKERG